jgi:hypothetical protein
MGSGEGKQVLGHEDGEEKNKILREDFTLSLYMGL